MTHPAPTPPRLVAIDFETYYEDEATFTPAHPGDLACSIGAHKGDYAAYCRHPRFDAYLVAITDGINPPYVGPPALAPWNRLRKAIVVAHNAAFEHAVATHLTGDRTVPANLPADLAGWHCTATDFTAPKGRRSLKDAAALHLDHEVDKSPRAAMAGRRYADLSPGEQAALRGYCLLDASLTLRLAALGIGARTPGKESV